MDAAAAAAILSVQPSTVAAIAPTLGGTQPATGSAMQVEQPSTLQPPAAVGGGGGGPPQINANGMAAAAVAAAAPPSAEAFAAAAGAAAAAAGGGAAKPPATTQQAVNPYVYTHPRLPVGSAVR